MSKQEDFGRPEKPPEKTREIDSEARISKKAEMKRKFNRNQKRIKTRKSLKPLGNRPGVMYGSCKVHKQAWRIVHHLNQFCWV